jgi:hypothetical protein
MNLAIIIVGVVFHRNAWRIGIKASRLARVQRCSGDVCGLALTTVGGPTSAISK